jgi:hypothetical protein
LLTADKLRKLRIFPETTLDSQGRQFFLPLGPQSEWNRKYRDIKFWFYRWSPEVRDATPHFIWSELLVSAWPSFVFRLSLGFSPSLCSSLFCLCSICVLP